MNFDLSPEHELLRDTVRRFAVERVAPVAEELDREKRFPYELVAELAELGLTISALSVSTVWAEPSTRGKLPSPPAVTSLGPMPA